MLFIYSKCIEVFQHLKEFTIKYTGVLKWILIFGGLIIVIGLTYFLGIFEIDFEYSLLFPPAPVNSLYGITYFALYAFGFYLVIFALLLILPTLTTNQRKGLNKYQKFFIALGVFGLGLISYSLLINPNILPILGSNQKWFDYFIIGMIISFSNYLVLMFSTKNFQELSNYNWVWFLLVCTGIITEFLSLLTYWSLLRIIWVSPTSWGDLYFIGLIFLFLGGLPLLLSYKPTGQKESLILGILSLILIISGIITYLAPTLALNGIFIPLSIFKYNRYFDYLFFGSLLLTGGVALVSSLEATLKYLSKYSILWTIVLILGFFQYVCSILMEITDTYFIDLGLEFLFFQSARGSLLFGMPWYVFLFNGLITTFSALIIVSSLIFKESILTNKKQNSEEE